MLSSVIDGASSLLGSIVTAGVTSRQNQLNRSWQERMYYQQLADERENWNMQNAFSEDMYNKYSSPQAQARQMRLAGISPDLQDISAASSPQSSDIGNAEFPSITGQNPIDLVGAFVNLAEMVNTLRSQELDLDLKREHLSKIASSHAMDYLVKTYKPPTKADIDLQGFSSMGESFAASKSTGELWKYFRSHGLSKRAAKLASRYVRSTDVEKVRGEYYALKSSSDERRKTFLTGRSDPYYKDDDYDMIQGLNEFLSIKSDLDKVLFGSSKSKAKYESDYYSRKSGSLDAATDNRIAQSSADVAEAQAAGSRNQKNIDESVNDMLDGIRNPVVRLIVRILVEALGDSPNDMAGSFFTGVGKSAAKALF